jgi:lipopolysaccharide biosynthesis regulator YciM
VSDYVRQIARRLRNKTVYQCRYCGWKTRSPSRICDRCVARLGYDDLKPLPPHVLERIRRRWR